MERSIRRTNELPGSTVLFEARLSSSSPLVGKTLRDIRFPQDTLVASIVRQGETIFPRADSQLQTGDAIVVMSDPESERILQSFLGDLKPAIGEIKPTGR
jgi:Trk K+ transport system NAD-binding subunit